ncbi:hypothetical protein AB0F30_25465 [Streptomyces sp. NPDC029006]
MVVRHQEHPAVVGRVGVRLADEEPSSTSYAVAVRSSRTRPSA